LTLLFEGGSHVSLIGNRAFADCSSVCSVRIPASVETLCGDCFRNCGALSKVSFESGSKLSQIAPLAFANCGSLCSIELPPGLTRLEQSTFVGCSPGLKVMFAKGSKLSEVPPSAYWSAPHSHGRRFREAFVAGDEISEHGQLTRW
jgi:hypothetical protein